MNKVFNINLGGMPFTIDEDAFNYLKAYLQTVRKHFEKSESGNEIVNDIESRFAELFQSALKGKYILSKSNIQDAIKIMGQPEDFGAEPIADLDNQIEQNLKEDSNKEFSGTQQEHKQHKTSAAENKKLFRNIDDKVLGGVCSGMASYFGIHDPLWVRIAFVVVVLLGLGLGVPIYFALWLIVPAAKTSSDKLRMKGEPVNVSNIAKKIDEEFEAFRNKLNEFGDELKSKSK